MQLPLSIEGITPEWLTQALSIKQPGTVVDAIEEMDIIWGTATKVKLKLSYRNQNNSSPVPTHLCLKAGFTEETRRFVSDAFIREVNFYHHIAPQLSINLPYCWFTGADETQGQGIVIQDDLAYLKAEFGDPLHTLSVDAVASGLDQQARWHAKTWNATPQSLPWLHIGSWVRNPAQHMFTEAHWQRMFSDHSRFGQLPDYLLDLHQVKTATFRMWELDDRDGTPCLAHCDAHIGNTFINADGQIGFLDWQSPSLSPGIDDVAYFLVGSLSILDRQQHEEHLLRHYLEMLSAHGGPALDYNEVWKDYTRHHMHGYMWAVTPPEMQPLEKTSAMVKRYACALQEHDTFKALGLKK